MPYERSRDEVESALADHDYLRAVGSFSMQHSLVSVYSSTTVVRTPDTVLRGRWAGAEESFAGEQLLLNYRPDNARLGFQLGVGRFFEPDAVLTACHADLEEDWRDAITLPQPKKVRTGLTAAVTARRSTREFSGQPVTLTELSTLLHHAQGASGELPYGDPADPHGTIALRNAPSGGGLFPITMFVHALHVEQLPVGTYEYLPHAHALGPLRHPGGPPSDLADLLASPDLEVERAAVVLTFVYNLHHNSRKYGDSGTVFALLEAGAILQNIHLTRTALALAGVDQGSYDKQRIEQALGLDGHTRHVVHVTMIGQEG